MRTMPTKLSGVIVALTLLAYLPLAAFIQAQERDASLRKQALKLNEVTGKDAQLGEERSLLKDKAHAKKLVAEAVRMVDEKPQPFNHTATQILGILAIGVKDYGAAEKFYRLQLDQAKQLRSAKSLVTAYYKLIPLNLAKRKYAQAEKLCAEASQNKAILSALQNLELDNDEKTAKDLKELKAFISFVLEEQIRAIAHQDVDRAIKFIDRLLQDNSDGWLALDLKGIAYRLGGKHEEALKVYQDEIRRLDADNDLKKKDKDKQLDEIHYSLSGVYIELGDVEKAAKELKALLAKHPDHPTYNNDLGYVWADHDMNLAESEKLIRKALAEDRKLRQKDNPDLKPEEIKDRGAYLDSLGWVLYKQKKYVEAKRYLRQAVQNTLEDEDNESIEIYDHLGDVLVALGQKAEAVAAWKKGVEVAGDSTRDQRRKEEVQKKIKANE
jgi:tetratricopeptide (TPR) repeat protein